MDAALPPDAIGETPATEATRARAASVALWAFLGVATALFSLFLTAYAMRMDSPDWAPIAMPWQLWLSTALLLVASVLLSRAVRTMPDSPVVHSRRLLIAAGAVMAAFLASQLWAWQALADARVTLTTNPAASFFYVLTALHGLHVLGGLFAWGAAVHAGARWRVALCARYWHFLFALWVVLFAALALLTPEIVRAICGTG